MFNINVKSKHLDRIFMAEPTEVTVVPKRIGGSLAVFLPAEMVKRGGIREGVPVRLSLTPEGRSQVLGLLNKPGRHKPFDRHREGLWPDDQ